MENELFIFPLDISGEFKPDSLENCLILFQTIGAAALSIGEEYPDKKILVVYEL